MIPALPFIVGPAVGAVIGYLTNYLAVKMLFRPYTEKRIGRIRLPFTPGVIPRRRGALARALGEAVGSRLVTKADLAELLSSDESIERLSDAAVRQLLGREGESLEDRIRELVGEDVGKSAKERVDRAITAALADALASADLGALLLTEGANALRAANPMLGMFLGDALLEQLTPTVNETVRGYLAERGQSELLITVGEQTSALLGRDAPSLLAELGLSEDTLTELARGAVRRLLGSFLPLLLDSIDLPGIVARKINEMNMKELEALVLSVMQRELRAVVNLGGVIGFILGFVTAFF